MSTTFYSEGNTVDYTPVSEMVAGDAVKFGTFIGVANNTIPANTKGALRVNGICKAVKATALGAMTLGVEYDFDFTGQQVVAGGAGDADVKVFAAYGSGADDTETQIWLNYVGG